MGYKDELLKEEKYAAQNKNLYSESARSPASWSRITIFYCIFYTVLGILFMNLWWVFSQTLDPRTPRRRTTDSLIGTSPGLGFRPMPPKEDVLSSLIWYRGTEYANYSRWTDKLKSFLEVYRKPGITLGSGQNIQNCNYEKRIIPGQVCYVDIRKLAPCVEEEYFGYHQSSPCVMLKLNKVYGWTPEYYNDTNKLPHDMPQNLKSHIKGIAKDPARIKELNTVWISCRGESPADEEHVGKIEYYPLNGFPGYFFPYENSEGYLSPLVAVKFVRPRTGLLINVECRAWAKNIKYKKRQNAGAVHFELMID